MKRIYEGQVGQIVPTDGGIVFALGEKTFGGQIAVTYKYFSFKTLRIEKAERGVYLKAKFGPNYERFLSLFSDYINCHVTELQDGKKIVVSADGSSIIFDEFGKVYWHGDLKYNDSLPLDIVYADGFVWVSYPDINCVVKYDSKNMHQVFRAGGINDDAFLKPCGLFYQDSKLLVCCPDSNEIKAFDTESFGLKTYAKLAEPVYRYYKIGVNEIVLLESGVYVF